MIFLYIYLFYSMVLVGRQDWKVFANVSMMSTLFLNMSTQAQAQHCKEYMQPVCINTQATLVLPKHIVEPFKKKLITSEEGGSGVNQGARNLKIVIKSALPAMHLFEAH
ncbi:hypothetical protein BCON_0034g00330 [Botryotinia convoluta]|uniref:Uncharacterized protein n=1 Tax=Botryotinia convoluta TaxID=54673 RepID=A0A4Z1IVK2_9HELO|nr:hypothetical protein BCON_0034g00330 [Botryotinia convoluta]